MKKLLIIDTFNFLHRAYHALPKTFTDPNGEPTNAVYGVTSMVINILNSFKPNYVVAALDSQETTFRAEDFTAYKAHRKPMEDDLSSQLPKVFEILKAFGIKQIVVDGYEADDVIATISEKFHKDAQVTIFSNDRDLWQLLNGNVRIVSPGKKGEIKEVTKENAEEFFGFEVKKIPDYKGLRGDPSDNIPGVYGVGDKTARDLVLRFGSVEGIYKNIEQIEKPSLKEKLLNNAEEAVMSKKLAQLVVDAPLTVELDELKYSDFNKVKVKEVLERYNFKSLIKRLGFEPVENKEPPVPDNQLSLL